MELRECPFCGSIPRIEHDGGYRFYCVDCGIRTPGYVSMEELKKVWNSRCSINTPKHETVEELRIVIEKTEGCAKVSLKYGDKLLTSEAIQSSNILISNSMLSHIRGTVANLIMDVSNGKPEIEG